MKYTFTEDHIKRLWSNIDRRSDNECWNWLRSVNSDGYGYISLNGKQWRAHKLSYLLHYKKISAGMKILHKCNNRLCCNPQHLKEGTDQDNMTDKVLSNRQAKGLNNGNAKLSDAEAREIVALYKSSNLSQKEIGKRFGIHNSHVSRLVRGEQRVVALCKVKGITI